MTKLSVRIKKGRFVLVSRDMPDLEEAKRMWREGKSAQQILEEHKKRKRDKG